MAEARTGQPLQYFEEALDSRDEARFGVKIGGAAGQQVWEALAVLCGIKLWAKLVRGRQMLLRVRSDSCAALRLAGKLASASPLLNSIGAEMALELEALDVDELVTEHIPGVLNALADALSRIHQPGKAGEVPDQLLCAKRKRIDFHADSFWQAWTASA